MPKLIIGDIHGNYPLLKKLLNISNFNYQTDTLIVLGDVCDGHPYVSQCIDELLKISNCILIQSNHDNWALNWMLNGIELPIWYHQGGIHTISSYNHDYKTVPQSHIDFLESAIPYYKFNTHINNQVIHNVCVHGGFHPHLPIHQQNQQDLTWDRSLCTYALTQNIPNYSNVYVGHTATQFFTQNLANNTPIHNHNLWMLDTGAGNEGPLSAIWAETNEIIQAYP